MSFYTYILYSQSADKHYIGSCEDITLRLEQHNGVRNTSTKHGVPWTIKFSQAFPTRQQAVQYERLIKAKKSRKYIEWLISNAT